ncbi:MAG: Ldh family oxidoreductase [Kiritimatiellia bacterium]
MIRVPIPELRERAVKVLISAGARRTDAEVAVDHMIAADQWGRASHGLSLRFKYVLRQIADGAGSAAVEVVKDAGYHVLLDGHNSLGSPAGCFAISMLIERSKIHGLACVALRNTRHAGMLGYYTERGARAGILTIGFANCYPLVAPHGGARPLLGTNPISIAFPAAPDPIVVDMATSAITMGELAAREASGQELPPNTAIDRSGKPTVNPVEARSGALLPFGGHKGAALALSIQLLAGAFTGSPPVPPFARDYGLLFLGFKKDLFQPAEQYDAAVAQFLQAYLSVPPLPNQEVRLPGSRRYANLRSRQDDCLEISEELAQLFGLNHTAAS